MGWYLHIVLVFVLKILGGTDVMQKGPVFACTYKRSRKDHSVEGNVILSHELIQLHFGRILPPLLPLIGVVGSDGKISNRRIKPDIKHLCCRRKRCE